MTEKSFFEFAAEQERDDIDLIILAVFEHMFINYGGGGGKIVDYEGLRDEIKRLKQ